MKYPTPHALQTAVLAVNARPLRAFKSLATAGVHPLGPTIATVPGQRIIRRQMAEGVFHMHVLPEPETLPPAAKPPTKKPPPPKPPKRKNHLRLVVGGKG